MPYKSQHRTFEFRAKAAESGEIEGAAAVIGNLDSYRTVIFPGYFTDEVLADFLRRGFIADSHDWSKPIGMPRSAEVRGRELFTVGRFHSDPESQVVRTRAVERIDNALQVGLSIGFLSAEERPFKNGQALLDYASSQGFDMALFDAQGIAAFAQPCRGLILCKRLFEYSIVSVPANDEATAPDVRADDAGGLSLGADLDAAIAAAREFVAAAETMSAWLRDHGVESAEVKPASLDDGGKLGDRTREQSPQDLPLPTVGRDAVPMPSAGFDPPTPLVSRARIAAGKAAAINARLLAVGAWISQSDLGAN
jgi:phage head maturation protease